MTRREAKRAARAAERAAYQGDHRPFGGLACEADLVAMQQFVPSARAAFQVRNSPVSIVTVLPGAVAAMVRPEAEGGESLVALQSKFRSQNPGHDLAFALDWAVSAEPGSTLQSTAADGSQPKITELIGAAERPEIDVYQDFSWWFSTSGAVPPQIQQALRQANNAVLPSEQLRTDLPGSIWWVNPGGGKAHIRWVRTEDDEARMLLALARIAARGELNLGSGTKFAGAFRTHGLIVPVFDVDPAAEPASFGDELADLDVALRAAYGTDAPLSTGERKQLDNIKSREVTI